MWQKQESNWERERVAREKLMKEVRTCFIHLFRFLFLFFYTGSSRTSRSNPEKDGGTKITAGKYIMHYTFTSCLECIVQSNVLFYVPIDGVYPAKRVFAQKDGRIQ